MRAFFVGTLIREEGQKKLSQIASDKNITLTEQLA